MLPRGEEPPVQAALQAAMALRASAELLQFRQDPLACHARQLLAVLLNPGCGLAFELEAEFAGKPKAPQQAQGIVQQVGFGEGHHLAALQMRQPPKLADIDIAWLADALGLSRSEARLAAQLGDGLRLKEAATQLGWTEETVRSCSKTIYAKMGVQGQAGLLRQLQGAGLWPGDAGDIAPPQTSA